MNRVGKRKPYYLGGSVEAPGALWVMGAHEGRPYNYRETYAKLY